MGAQTAKAPDLIWRVFQDKSLMDYELQVISIRESSLRCIVVRLPIT